MPPRSTHCSETLFWKKSFSEPIPMRAGLLPVTISNCQRWSLTRNLSIPFGQGLRICWKILTLMLAVTHMNLWTTSVMHPRRMSVLTINHFLESFPRMQLNWPHGARCWWKMSERLQSALVRAVCSLMTRPPKIHDHEVRQKMKGSPTLKRTLETHESCRQQRQQNRDRPTLPRVQN